MVPVFKRCRQSANKTTCFASLLLLMVKISNIVLGLALLCLSCALPACHRGLQSPEELIWNEHRTPDYSNPEEWSALPGRKDTADDLPKNLPKDAVETYLNIPENKPLFFDVLIKNVSVEVDGKTAITDIGILYEEVLTENQIHFVPKISVIDCLKDYGAHRFIDGEFEALALSNNKKIELGATISHFLLNRSQFALFINNNLH